MTNTAALQPRLDRLRAERPELAPVLALIDVVREASADEVWADAASVTRLAPERQADEPILTGVTIPVPAAAAGALLRRLLTAAGLEAASPDGARREIADPLAVLAAVLAGDEAALERLAAANGIEPTAFAAVAAYAVLPLLRAEQRRWAAPATPGWDRGWCPVCGRWPLLAERRGLERARRLRCGGCGADWAFPEFRCVFCGETDHAALGALVPEGGGEAQKVDTCDTCRGALRSLATLRAWDADGVLMADAATGELDYAAAERGYAPPDQPAARLNARVVAP